MNPLPEPYNKSWLELRLLTLTLRVRLLLDALSSWWPHPTCRLGYRTTRLKKNPNASSWVNLGAANRYKAMSYPALAKILRVAAKRAGLKKRLRSHELRRSRTAFLASRLTEAQMNQVFGWREA